MVTFGIGTEFLERIRTSRCSLTSFVACAILLLFTNCDHSSNSSKPVLQSDGDVASERSDQTEEVVGNPFLTASTDLFRIRIEWEIPENRRRITVATDEIELPPFVVDLIDRPRPWTQSWTAAPLPEFTMTRYGPYMPGAHLTVDDEEWHVVVSHEIVDFPTENDLRHFIDWKNSYFTDSFALDSSGIYAELVVHAKGGETLGNSLNLTVHYLFVDGKRPPADLLEKFVKGDVSTNHVPEKRNE